MYVCLYACSNYACRHRYMHACMQARMQVFVCTYCYIQVIGRDMQGLYVCMYIYTICINYKCVCVCV